MRWLSGEIVTQELPIVKAVGQVTAVSDNDCNESAEMVNQDIVEVVADSENDSIAMTCFNVVNDVVSFRQKYYCFGPKRP